MKSPIRRLDGITYWVIEDQDAIYEFINTNLRYEWEADARSERRRPEDDNWLTNLPKRKWNLETVETTKIRLNPSVTRYVDDERGYSFAASLEKRVDSLSRDVATYATVIWPIIIRGEDMMLMDGYCRHSALRKLKVPEALAYVGRERKP